MPINKVSLEKKPTQRFDWQVDDLFIVANWQNNTSIAHSFGDELYEIIGTEKQPLAYSELTQLNVDVDALYLAGQLGVKKGDEYIFYRDTFESYDDSYYEEPPQSRGFSFANEVLDTENRKTLAQQDSTPYKVDPEAVPPLDNGEDDGGAYGASNS